MYLNQVIRLTLRSFLVLSAVILSLGTLSPVAAQNTACPDAPQPHLSVGRDGYVAPGGNPNNLRAQPTIKAAIVAQIQPDTDLQVISGPTCADHYNWWQVSTYANQTGWMAEADNQNSFIMPTTSSVTVFQIPANGTTVPVVYNGVSLLYDGAFGKRAESDTVFASRYNPQSPTNLPPFAFHPAYTEIVFDKVGGTLINPVPRIMILPIDDYAKLVPQVNEQADQLRKLLAQAPAQFPVTGTEKKTVPVLPLENAAQVFTTNVKYFAFGGGTGLRFITMYSQGVIPVTNDVLHYYYQGITQDGKYWVSAEFPIHALQLGNTQPTSENDIKAFIAIASSGDAYTAYLQGVATKLNGAQPSDFSPTLDSLDTLLQTLNIAAQPAGQ